MQLKSTVLTCKSVFFMGLYMKIKIIAIVPHSHAIFMAIPNEVNLTVATSLSG